MSTFSPPAWGWSDQGLVRRREFDVLPTRVGMVRTTSPVDEHPACSPHPRGDGPITTPWGSHTLVFSPPAWGWSVLGPPDGLEHLVLPTRVGMVRWASAATTGGPGSPHPRGDGPIAGNCVFGHTQFSPPAWGWSGSPRAVRMRAEVLPTRVGMVRSARRRSVRASRSPHPRGDGP